MKNLKFLFVLLVAVPYLYAQSTITIGKGTSISIGSGSNVSAGYRDGTLQNSGYFNSRSITFNPVATAASGFTSTSFNANWNASAGANGYRLDVSADPNFGSFIAGYQNIDVGNVTSFNVNSGLSSGATYYYRVRAYDIDGITGYSNVITVVMPPPSPVASAATGITDLSFNANWGASTGATKYYLDVSTDISFGVATFVTGYQNLDVGNVVTYSVNTNLSSGTTYYYRVRGYNTNGTSDNSGTITVLTIPSAPTATAATLITQTSFSANWNVSTGAAKYYLDVSTDVGFGAGTFVTGYQNLDVGNVTTYSVNTNINSGTTYYYRVRSNNATGTSGNSGTITVLTIPSNPTATAATLITQTSFSANWNVVTGAAKYYLDVSTDIGFGAGTFVAGYENIDVGNVVTYSVNTNLSTGTTYYYRVRANNATGTSGNSGTITVLTIPSAPTATAATLITQTSFSANWNASTGATKYYLDVSTDSNFGAGTFVTGYQNVDVGNVVTYSVNTNLTSGTAYYYRVRANNATGTSGNSNSINLVTIPPDPTSIAATNINELSFSANWNLSTGATKYYLDVSTNANFDAGTFVTGFENKDVGNVNTYSVSGLSSNTTYNYRVRAYNVSGISGSSATIAQSTAPAVPIASAATLITQTSFSANWNASAGATKYYLDVSTDASFGAGTFVTGYQNLDVGNVTTYSVNTNISGGTTYYYRLRANSVSGTSSNSGTITVITIPPTPTATVATSITQTSFSANWNASAGAVKYYLDVSTDSGFGVGTFVTGYQNLDVGNVTTYSVNTNINAGITYYYRVRSNNATGTSGNSGTITVLTVPSNPTATAATLITQTSFSANWNSSTGATKYYLDVSTDAAFGAGTFVTGYQNLDVGNVVTYSVSTNLSSGTTYYYRIRAFNGSGTSSNSNTINLITIPPNPIAAAAANILSTSFDANWNASTGATKYYLDVSTDVGFGAGTFVTGYQNLDVGNVITYSVSGLSPSTTYYYRARSYNVSGTSGNSGTITVLTIPSAPTATAATIITSSSFSANWNASTGATKYYLDVSTDVGFGAGTFVTGYQNLDVGNVTTYSVNTNISSGTTYYYRVRAFNASGSSSNSGTITALTIPSAPTATAATLITQTSFSANWSASTGATKYYLDVSTDVGFGAGTFVTGYQNLDVGNVTTYSVSTNISSGTTYYYRVRANNATGTSGNSGTITVLTIPSNPTATAATLITLTSFSANWNAVTGAAKYYLDVSTDSNFGAGTFVTGYQNLDVGNVVTFSVNTSISSGTTYYYRVRANNATGTSGNSGTITVLTIPSNPTATAATNITDLSFDANWNASIGTTKYYLDVSTNSGFVIGSFVAGFENKDVGNITTYSVTGLSSNSTYYYRIRATNATGTSGNSGTITALTVPTAPTATAATLIVQTSFSANWGTSTGATKYYLDVSTNSGFGAGTFVTGYQNLDVGNVTTYSVNTNISSGTTYYYRVRAFSANGTSVNSSTITVLTIPATPTATAATSITDLSFIANWNAPTGATKYYLDVSTNSSFGVGTFVSGYQNLDVGNVIIYSVNTNLSSGTTYYYRVRSYNATGSIGNSNTINLITSPASPVATAATLTTQTSFSANWNASTGAAKYYLDVSTDVAFGAGTFVTGYQNFDVGNVTTYSVNTNLSSGTTYYYRVRANNVSGTSNNSSTITVLTIPSTPTATAATNVTDLGFRANWNASNGTTKYYFDVSTNVGFTAGTFVMGLENKDVGNVTTFSVSGLSPNTTYYYRVRANNATGTSGNSVTITVVTAPSGPTATSPTLITQASFSANWNASSGATKYYFDVSTDGGFAAGKFVTGYQNIDVGNVTTYSVNTNLTSGTTYYYRVRAFSPSGISGNSNTISLVTVPPNPIVTVASNILNASFVANWNASAGADKYYLDVSTDAGFVNGTFVTGYQNLDVGNVTTYSVNTNLSGGTTYYYRVSAYNGGGTSGNSSTMTVLMAPASPTAIAATLITQTSFSANWNASTGAAKYYLDVSTDVGFSAETFVTGYQNLDVGNVTTFAVNTNLTSGTIYYYRVRTYNASGTSGNSETITVLTIPSTPTSNAATSVTDVGFNANWSASTGAVKYYLDLSTDAGFAAGTFVAGFENKDVGNVTIYSFTGLSASVTYYYRVRANNASGSSGNSGTITVLTIPSVPTAIVATLITQTSFSANWNASAGSTKYYLDVSTDGGFRNGTFVAGFENKDVGNVTAYSVNTNLFSGTIYYYRVRAFSVNGTSNNSNIIGLVTIPSTPTAKAATDITSTSFSANWNSVTGADKYFLDVATDEGFNNMLVGYNNKDVANVTTSHISNIPKNTTFYFRVRSNNTSGSSGNSNTVSLTTLPNFPPTISGIETAQLNFTEGDSPQQITASTIVNDSDDLNLERAVIQITTNYQKGEDILSFTNQNGITGIWDLESGSLTLTGAASLALYQSAIRDVKYQNISIHPKVAVRTVSIFVNDGTINSNILTRNISITPVNIPPKLSNIESDALQYKIKQSQYALTNKIVVEDADDYNKGSVIIAIAENYRVGEDQLVFEAQNGITSIWNSSSGILYLTGNVPVSNYQTALRSVFYKNNKAIPNTNYRTINIIFNDGEDNSNSISRRIEFASVNIAPLLTGIEISKIIYSINSDRVTVTDSVRISDEDDLFLQSGEVKIREGFLAGEDVLEFEVPQQINGFYNSSNGTLTFSGQGDITTYQNIFRSVRYKNIKGTAATNSNKTIAFSVMDGSQISDNATRQILVEGTVTTVENWNEVPKEFALFQNFPNPFNPSTKLRYGLPKAADVHLSVYNILGEEVKTLFAGNQNTGYHEVELYADDLPSGIYIYRIIAGEFVQTKKMILLK